MNKTTLLIIAAVLIFLGIFKPDFSHLLNRPDQPVVVEVVELVVPGDDLKVVTEKLVKVISSNEIDKQTRNRLRDLYIDLAKLIELDETNQIITSTEEIRQANSISGIMLGLDIKGKYKDLAEASRQVILEAIGDDQIPLNKDLRPKAVKAFLALAWAYNNVK